MFNWQYYLLGTIMMAFVAGVMGYQSRGNLICIEIEG